MRHGIGLFALVFGCIIISVAARYGFKTSDNEVDGYIWAAIYGGVTLAGLCGHMIGVRLWRYGMHKLSLSIFAVSLFVLLISLSNSLGAMAGRMNETVAARLHTAETIRNARDSLKGDEAELKRLRDQNLKPAEWTEVEAANTKANAATEARKLACAAGGTTACYRKQTAEDAALKAQGEVSGRKATAERIAKLEASIEAHKKTITEAGPELEANSQGNALARLFALPEGDAAKLSTYQNLAMAFGIELLIALALILYEVMREHELERMPKPEAPQAPRTIAEPMEAIEAITNPVKLIEHVSEEEQEEPVDPLNRLAAPVIEDGPKAFPVPPRPRLIASRPDPVGNVVEIMAEILEPGRGKVKFTDVFAAYAETCEAHGKRPISANEFPAALADLCKRLGIEIENNAKGVFLLKVRLKKSEKSANA